MYSIYKKILTSVILLSGLLLNIRAQDKSSTPIERWQDLKFGLIIHWGLYSELGIVESWAICSEEEDWIGRDSTIAYEEFKRNYWNTIYKFNPVNFAPEQWARIAGDAGMKYVVFTTKHHDGFCLFDSEYTDFTIKHGPFGNHPRSNVAKEVFEAFRNEKFLIGAYFSKPDWHSQYYWWDRYATPNRNNNYDIRRNLHRWELFKEYTYNQIEEIVGGGYGKIDILWLDGGWVKGEQDIDMPKIAKMVKGHQPEIILVDRSVPGEFEEYTTPERGIPDTLLNYPWESCIPLGNDWGYVPDDPYKSPEQIVRILVEIVAKGGNFLLGIGPKPDGTIGDDVAAILSDIGKWLNINGEAIYSTKPSSELYHYKYSSGKGDADIWFTQNPENGKRYAILSFAEDTKPFSGIVLPPDISTLVFTGKKNRASLLGVKGKVSISKRIDGSVEIQLPEVVEKDNPDILPIFVLTY